MQVCVCECVCVCVHWKVAAAAAVRELSPHCPLSFSSVAVTWPTSPQLMPLPTCTPLPPPSLSTRLGA